MLRRPRFGESAKWGLTDTKAAVNSRVVFELWDVDVDFDVDDAAKV